jgi:hypothetical protein
VIYILFSDVSSRIDLNMRDFKHLMALLLPCAARRRGRGKEWKREGEGEEEGRGGSGRGRKCRWCSCALRAVNEGVQARQSKAIRSDPWNVRVEECINHRAVTGPVSSD